MENKGLVAEQMITIPIMRFEELVRIEDRVDVLVRRCKYESYVSEEDMLRTIGTAEALAVLGERENKDKK